jgi:hypothetical protein
MALPVKPHARSSSLSYYFPSMCVVSSSNPFSEADVFFYDVQRLIMYQEEAARDSQWPWAWNEDATAQYQTCTFSFYKLLCVDLIVILRQLLICKMASAHINQK